MKLEFELSKQDYKNSLIELITKEFCKRAIFICLICILVSASFADNPISWIKFSITSLLTFLILFLFLFGKSMLNLYKTEKIIKINPLFTGKKNVELENDGIIFGQENPIKYNWHSIKKIEILSKYIYIIFQDETSALINKEFIDSEIINDFIGKIKHKTEVKNVTLHTNQSKNIYWLGILGLIPNFGLIIGGILFYIGFNRRDKKLKVIGTINILFTPLFWLLFTSFMNNSEFVRQSNIEFTNHNLNEIVKDLELYKVNNGQYPDSLGDLKSQNKFLNVNELFNEIKLFKESQSTKLYYEKNQDEYILKSFGPDRILNTQDDIYPTLKPNKE